MGAAEKQDGRTDTAPLRGVGDRGCLPALEPSCCGLAEAQPAGSGTLHPCIVFYQAELVWCRTLVLAAPAEPSVVVGGMGDADGPAGSGPLFSWLQCEAKGVVGKGKGKEKGERPGA